MKLLIIHFSPAYFHLIHFFVQIFSSASFSEIPTVYVLPLMLEIKYNIHTNNWQNYCSVYVNCDVYGSHTH
jgi:hypothetical protein